MAYTTINDPTQYFNTVLYTGTGSARDVTGYGFQPDWVWIKQRSGTTYHRLYDSSRGAGQEVYSNATDAEADGSADQMSAFISDGFSIPTSGGNYTNINTATYVAWGWKANAGSTSSNTDGTITSTVQANTTAGFSIVTYTGTGTTGTVGHGLGKVPKVLITKDRDTTFSWNVYHAGVASDAETDYLVLEGADAVADNVNRWNDTAPTSSVFTVASSSPTNTSGNNILAYCFAEIKGYSKFGSYTGNGSADGTFVYTGFKPAWVLFKRTDSSANWHIYDSTRNTINAVNKILYANLISVEAAATSNNTVDFVSNGIKNRGNGAFNTSGATYIYMAFAENPFVSSDGVPTTAR